MFGLIKKIFTVVLFSIVNLSNHAKCVSLSNQKCMIQPNLFNLYPNEYSQEFHYYPFSVKLDRCVVIILNLSSKVYILNKTEDLNLSVFNMITGINEPEPLTKHISCECKCKFDGKNVIEINGGVTINFDVTVKNIIYVKKIMFGILLHLIVKMENI